MRQFCKCVPALVVRILTLKAGRLYANLHICAYQNAGWRALRQFCNGRNTEVSYYHRHSFHQIVIILSIKFVPQMWLTFCLRIGLLSLSNTHFHFLKYTFTFQSTLSLSFPKVGNPAAWLWLQPAGEVQGEEETGLGGDHQGNHWGDLRQPQVKQRF